VTTPTPSRVISSTLRRLLKQVSRCSKALLAERASSPPAQRLDRSHRLVLGPPRGIVELVHLPIRDVEQLAVHSTQPGWHVKRQHPLFRESRNDLQRGDGARSAEPGGARTRLRWWLRQTLTSRPRPLASRGRSRSACVGRRRCHLGAPGRSRTRNLTGRNRLLYPVELQGRRGKRSEGTRAHW
jgi:hypothetical protein